VLSTSETTASNRVYCRCAALLKYFDNSLNDATKTVKFVEVVPKTDSRATSLLTKAVLSRVNLKKFWGIYLCRRWYVVVQPRSNFYLRCKRAPLQGIKFQTSDFAIFCARKPIIVIF